LSTEHSGKSQLTLGHIVNETRQKRGEGFELRSSAWGALRAGNGLLISADDEPNAAGSQLDMQAALAQLQSALSHVANLVNATTAANAESADKATQAGLKDALDQLTEAGLIATAPAGIALATPRSIQHAAGKN